jgi:FlaA1/EpsC-like NDP-sugar epimerase
MHHGDGWQPRFKTGLQGTGSRFRALKEIFWLNYSVVLAVVVVNSIMVTAVVWLAAVAKPDKGIMVFLFFLATQALVFLRLMMKAWRYAAVCEAVQGE